MTDTVILGSGMAGLGAAYRLRAAGLMPVIYDAKPYHGGHTASFRDEGGFVFDEGPHISFTKNERIRALLADGVDGKYQVIRAKINNYWNGYWVKHPVQCNLFGLPVDLVVNVIRDFIQARQGDAAPRTYEDWLLSAYGRTFAETFPIQYGRKYHTAHSRDMTTDWLGPRLYRPALEEVLRGALSQSTPDVHYIDEFRYPTQGGFASFLTRLTAASVIRLHCRLVELDTRARELRFANGAVVPYGQVISSIPLPDLIPLIVEAPEEVRRAATRLACTTCVVVNVGVAREDISEAHWSYFYDEDIFFTRVSYPHMFSPHNAPPGAGSIQAEVYFSDKYKPMVGSAEDCIGPVITDLRRCGLLRQDDRILTKSAKTIRYANVIYDTDRAGALSVVHGYLDEVGVRYCGRYGEWGYHWTDEAFVSGENAAQKVLDQTYRAVATNTV